MSHTRRLLAFLLIGLCVGLQAAAQTASPGPASPAPSSAPLAPAQAQDALAVLRDEKRRAELITTLEAIAKAAPAAAPAPVGASAPAPVGTSAPAPAGTAAPTVPPLAPDSLGVQVVTQVSAAVTEAGSQVADSVRDVNDLPLLWRWLQSQAQDPEARQQIGEASWKLAVVLACALAADLLLRRLLRRLRATVNAWAPATVNAEEPELPGESGEARAEAGETEPHRHRLNRAFGALRQLPFLLGRLVLDLLPIAGFVLIADLLLATRLGQPEKTRLVVLEAVQAYTYAAGLLALAALLFSPASPPLRLLHVSHWAAAFLTRWTRRIVIVAVVGIAISNIGLLFGMYRTAHDAVLKLFGLAIHAGLVVAVLQARGPVAARLHARKRAQGVWASLLNRFAEIWHFIAIFYLVGLWLVWAVELRNGYVRLINFCVATFAVLFGARLASVVVLGGLDRTRTVLLQDRSAGLASRAGTYYPVLRGAVIAGLWALTGVVLLEVWGVPVVSALAASGLGGRVMQALLTIGLTVVIAVVVWEAANAGIERHLQQLSSSAQLARAGRLRTLLPLLRSILLITIVLVVALMALSEIGVNIAPLLAGAGVVGIAVGFGSQKLVQDLITGLFLLLENAMQVGDVVTVAGLSGTVEALTIRTIRLRALDGAVHLIPFSSVTTVTNQTRDYSYAVLDVNVGLNEEPDPIADVIRQVAATMQSDPDWQSMVLDKLDVMGVEKLTDLAWILRVRIKTQPGSRWAVARELNRRIKIRFDELAIESPFTSHKVLSREPPPPPATAVEQEQAA
ncbi:MAG: mechanosensitive ion channel [Acetobacteraceae bacterium]|nr:mechanosensitive ion channel [Acetobacteraceae bacterium]